jgi:mycoredoxin
MTDNAKIKFYGTTWCPGCRRAQKLLTNREIEYEWINISEDVSGREFVMEVNNGYRSVPTIVFPDGDILVEPSNAKLAAKLSQI